MLIDDVTITIKAGNGGNGSVHFKRNAQTAKGGPDGGNGGNGGNLYVQGINDILGLREFQFKKSIQAEDGVNGGRQNLFGRNGEDTIIKIPLGTLLTDATTHETWEIVDTTTQILLARGGKGGRGNDEFKSPTDQAPHYAEKGAPGEERILHLLLRIIADIGFIGLPNAGKSSLLKALTNAKPKIGDYPFTTLEPNLGVMEGIILADIPGLIEGAHQGKGLGIKFLKHVEKTHVLFHCLDVTDENITKTYEIVRKELESFSDTLAHKKEIILLTKIDLIDTSALEEKRKTLKKFGKEILEVSIYDDEALEKLRKLLINNTTPQSI
jgi:GTPase